MATTKLNVVFEGPSVSNGVPLEDIQKTWGHVQTAVRLMVHHLRGGDKPFRGRPRDAVREISTLQFTGSFSGSLGTSLALAPAADDPLFADEVGGKALDAILSFEDGSKIDRVPEWVADELRAIASDLTDAVSQVRIGDPANGRQVVFRRQQRRTPRPKNDEAALLFGWLREVNWEKRSAQLHDDTGAFVALRFDPELADDMRRCATQHVRVDGGGRFNERDEWTTVRVNRISATKSWRAAFSASEFAERPEPKIFDPATLVTASEPFDTDDFVASIAAARHV